MNGMLAQGYCDKCRQPRLSVNGDTKCLMCEVEPSAPRGPVSTVEDPGEEKLRGMLAGTGVAIPKAAAQKPAAKPENIGLPKSVDIVPNIYTFDSCITTALAWLKGAPMPNDVKQFKTIQKVIKSLEGLTEK